ncbi:MAG TPA: hypothetical protein VKB30_07265, partial [Candidatus Limnocylindrales bacterium]|nr:hypothetical protein [Candidatus Limnocylindrales bacterium]
MTVRRSRALQRRGLLPAVLLAVLVAACAGGDGGGASTAPSGSGASTSTSPSDPGGGASGAASQSAAASASLTAGEFENPVIDRNFADPFILAADGTYYAYATSDPLTDRDRDAIGALRLRRIPFARSSDLV